MTTALKILICYYIVINVVLLALMGIDKAKAKKNKWRIKEATLLICALIGGGIGGLLGMKLFHHKTKKWYFHVVFIFGVAAHIALLWYAYIKI